MSIQSAKYYSDAGSAITAEVETVRDFLPEIGDPDERKKLNYLYIFATPISTLRVFISYDGEDFELLGQVTEYPQKFSLGGKKCSFIQLKFTESSSNRQFNIEAYLVVGDKLTERV
jgi:hypothetical protein